MSEIPSPDHFFFSPSSRTVQMEQSTQSFHFLRVLMFLCGAYPACVFTVPIFSPSLHFFYVFPLFNSKTNYMCMCTGWMHEKEHPSESIIIIGSAPKMNASSTHSAQKRHFIHMYRYLGRVMKKNRPDYIITFIMVAYTKKALILMS